MHQYKLFSSFCIPQLNKIVPVHSKLFMEFVYTWPLNVFLLRLFNSLFSVKTTDWNLYNNYCAKHKFWRGGKSRRLFMPLHLIEIFTDINNEFIAEENNFWITRINCCIRTDGPFSIYLRNFSLYLKSANVIFYDFKVNVIVLNFAV